MSRNSFTVLFGAVLCCVILVTEGRTTQLFQTIGDESESPQSIYIEDIEDTSGDTEDARFLSGSSSTGSATASAINSWITREQQALEKLRPQGGTSSTGANVIYVNAASSTSSTTSGSGIANVLIPQVINSALGGRRGAQRRRRRPTGNRNRNRSGGAQIFLVRP